MLGVPVSFVYDQYLQLTTVAVLISVLLAVAMYAKSFGRDLMLAEGGNSGVFERTDCPLWIMYIYIYIYLYC